MAKYKIAWLPGDGIGKDVLDAVRIVLDAIGFDAEYREGRIGWTCWITEGNPLPEETIELVKKCDAIMFGAITSKPPGEAEKELPEHLRGKVKYRSPIVQLRQILDLYVNMRPCKAYPGNPLNYKEGIDIVVFRENTEDLYFGVEVPEWTEELQKCHPDFARIPVGAAVSFKVITRRGSERIIRAAFEYARKHKRKKVTCVHKANVVRAADGLFRTVFYEIAQEYPDIEADDANVDSFCQWALKDPLKYDVVVAPNLYGDIISDFIGQMVGGLGFAPSANIGDKYALFEPVHGSAPKYAGKYIVNPIAAILSAKLMLEWLGETKLALAVEKAIEETIREAPPEVRTYDWGGPKKEGQTLVLARYIAEKAKKHLENL